MAWDRVILLCGDGRSEDDLTSLTDKMPVLEDKIITTSARYVNGELVAYTVETKYLGNQDIWSVGDSYWNSDADTKPGNFCSTSISDQSTIAGEVDATTPKESVVVRPSYIEVSSGKRMVDIFYYSKKISLPLDDLEMRGKESRVPESREDPIEALFHHEGDGSGKRSLEMIRRASFLC